MKEMKWTLAFSLLIFVCLAPACGGGGGGGSSESLTPPTYNINGTWSVTESVSSWGTCQPVSLTFSNFQVDVVHDGTSNSATVRDTRTNTPLPATISGASFKFSGNRYNDASAYCNSLTDSVSGTLSSATAFSGSGSVTCYYTGGSCMLNTSITANKP